MLGKNESEWKKVTSGVPQGSALGPALFLLYNNDLPNTIESYTKLFADDTKIYAKINTNTEKHTLKGDLDKLNDWSLKWKLRFNTSRCKVMHIGKKNYKFQYSMGLETEKHILDECEEEKDLGVHTDSKLNFSSHCQKVAAKAISIMGIIKRTFSNLDTDILTKLYKSMVRLIMEYSSSIWFPYLKKYISKLEKVERQATKLVAPIKDLSYSDRLQNLGLPTLEYRRLRYDMIQVYKLIHGIDYINNMENLLQVEQNSRTRGHIYKLVKPRCRTNRRNQSFFYRVIDNWNSLPEHVVTSQSTNEFKSNLNNH